MAGKVVDDFGNMTFMYILNIDNRYFFSRNVIIKPEDAALCSLCRMQGIQIRHALPVK
jgi:hypothetical protein